MDHLFLLRLMLAVALLGAFELRLKAAPIDSSLAVVVSVAEHRLALVEDGVIVLPNSVSETDRTAIKRRLAGSAYA